MLWKGSGLKFLEVSKESSNSMTFHSSRFVPVVVAVLSIATFAQTGPAPTASPAPSAATAPAATTPATPARIGIVDFRGAIMNTNEGQRDFETLRKKFEPKGNELDSLNRDIEDLKKQLSTTGDKLNEDARGNLLKQIDSKQKTLQRNYEDANNDLQAQQNEILTRIGQKMMAVLDKYAKEHGYSIILDYSNQASPVLWAANTVDVSPILVETYNSVSGVPPQPKTPGAGPAGAAAPKTTPKPAGGAATAPKSAAH
jgi:outer membrane protein